MKKALALALALIMVFALAACGGGKTESTPASSAPSSSAPAASQEEPGSNQNDGNAKTGAVISLVSDDKKLVANVDDDYTWGVWYYAGEAITAYEEWLECKDETEAKDLLDDFEGLYADDSNVESLYQAGKYVVVKYKSSYVENLSVTTVKEQFDQNGWTY